MPAGTVIKAQDYQILVEVGEMLNKVNAIIDKVKSDAAKTMEETKEQGYAEGLQQAHKEMYQRHLAMVEKSSDYIMQLESQIAATVVHVVRHVIDDYGASEALLQMVRQAMHDFISQPKVKIMVAPGKQGFFEEQLADLNNERKEKIKFVTSASLGDDECSIEGPVGILHLSLAKRLDVLLEALKTSPPAPRTRQQEAKPGKRGQEEGNGEA